MDDTEHSGARSRSKGLQTRRQANQNKDIRKTHTHTPPSTQKRLKPFDAHPSSGVYGPHREVDRWLLSGYRMASAGQPKTAAAQARVRGEERGGVPNPTVYVPRMGPINFSFDEFHSFTP